MSDQHIYTFSLKIGIAAEVDLDWLRQTLSNVLVNEVLWQDEGPLAAIENVHLVDEQGGITGWARRADISLLGDS